MCSTATDRALTAALCAVYHVQITQLKIEYNPFAKGFRGSDLTGGGRRCVSVGCLHSCLYVLCQSVCVGCLFSLCACLSAGMVAI